MLFMSWAFRRWNLLAAGLIVGIFASTGLLATAQSAATSEWTWMNGSSQGRQPSGVYGQLGVTQPGNTPGGREGAIRWTDAQGNLWLFGSQGGAFDDKGVFGYLDDVWEYNTSSLNWTWIAGSDSLPGVLLTDCVGCSSPQVFGSYQTPAPENTPGGIQFPAQWTDKSGNLWIFGGYVYTAAGGLTSQMPENALWEFNVSTHDWAWMGGTNRSGSGVAGIYGTLGEPAPGNTPGARSGATTWIDSSGNLWLFGGYGLDSEGVTGYLNDLWMFNPSINQWTWVGGSSTFSQGCLTKTAACAAPSVPGTLQTPAAGNVPLGRDGAFIWTDKYGDIWLFGGESQVFYSSSDSSGVNGIFIDDLWKFDSQTHQWAWMSGTPTPNGNAPQLGIYPGVYGTLGTPSVDNIPGARDVGSWKVKNTWTDHNGRLWLFGGNGYDSTNNIGQLNDLWVYDPSLNKWAWMGGSSTFVTGCRSGSCSAEGVYGTLGTPAANNTPGSRQNAAQWIDQSGNIWLFGGWGRDSADTWGMLNDLWMFNPDSDMWTWMGGSSKVPNDGSNSDGVLGVYGTSGVQAATNMPGGRIPAANWIDANGNFWLFGGYGFSSNNTFIGWLNDLWEYGSTTPAIPPSFNLSSVSIPVLALTQPGSETTTITSAIRGGFNSTITLSASGQPAGVTISFSPASITGAGSSTMNISIDSSAALGTFPILVTGISGNESETTEVTLMNFNPSAPTINPPGGTYTAAQSVTISSANPGAIIYYTTDNTTPTTTSRVYSGPITVSSSQTVQASALIAGGSIETYTAIATYTINIPVTATPVISPASGSYVTAPTVSISDATSGGTIYYTTDGSTPTINSAVYQGPFTLAASAVIKAIAVASNYQPSAVATADYSYWQATATKEWTWMGGPQTPQPAVYGMLGIPALENMPANRHGSAAWTDSAGNFWLFGGQGFDSAGKSGYLNDLWEYNPSTGVWAWMGGISTLNGQLDAPGSSGTLGTPAAGNIPEGRTDAVTWTDVKGNMWLFGGNNYGSCPKYFNDLWQFNPSTNEWTWISGSNQSSTQLLNGACAQSGVYGQMAVPAAGNIPGSRVKATSWEDSSGNLWLFGGTGYDSEGSFGPLNDLWEFSPSTNQWTWMAGSNLVRGSGIYGVEGSPASGNTPGARGSSSGWTDGKGNFWLFGGRGVDSSGHGGLLDDLWMFKPSTSQWVWMGGNSTAPSNCMNLATQDCGTPGVYGALQAPSPGNLPGARQGAVSWTDGQGNLWLFGGNGIDSTGKVGYLNDLWKFDPSTTEWTWMTGSSTVVCISICGKPGVYGTYQTPAVGNTPSGRADAVSWTDGKGNLWLFGGTGVNLVDIFNDFEDLWEFQPGSASLPVTSAPVISPGSGTYTTEQLVTISDPDPGAVIYYSINGGDSFVLYAAPIAVTSSETIEAYAVDAGSTNSTIATATYAMSIPAAAEPSFSLAAGTYATAQTVAISDSTAGSTIYYTTDGTMPTTASAEYVNPITVSSSALVQAIAVAPNYLNSSVASAVYTIGSISTMSEWTWMGGSSLANAAGSYGIRGIPSTANLPGSRSGAVRWTDKEGNQWLFGGSSSLSSIQVFNDLWKFNSSTMEWTWMNGASMSDSLIHGVYGTLGIAAPGNQPGARTGAAGWIDSYGNLWLFGGQGYDSSTTLGELNDLWKYDPSTNLWTWMGGSNKGTLSFYSSYGQRGIYGTLRVPEAGNIPGSRFNAASWTDTNGNFWLFGGTGQDAAGDSVTLNDMWEFNPSTSEWAWMGGANVLDPIVGALWGVYGTQGVSSPANIPGSRTSAAHWVDSSGNFWLFGGSQPHGSGGDNKLNDLWKFNPITKEWTWVGGSSTVPCTDYSASTGLLGGYFCGQLSVNGTLGVPAPGNFPGGRAPAAYWSDSNGNLWLFGGIGLDHAGQLIGGLGVIDTVGSFIGPINDLWYYTPSSNLWTWMGGNVSTSGCIYVGMGTVQCGGQPGEYGTQGSPDGGNVPGSRTASVSWTDQSGNLWLFSGWGQGASFFSDTETYPLNDIWEYRPSTATLPATPTPVVGTTPGTYASGGPVTIFDAMPNASIYYTTDGTTPTTASTLYNGPVSVSSSETIKAIATAPGYLVSGIVSATYVIIPPAATPVFSVPAGTYTTPQTVTITDATPGATILYTTDGGATVLSYTSPIVVSVSETLEAVATAPGYTYSAIASATYTINAPLNPAPILGGLSPAFIDADSAGFTLTVYGSGFVPGSNVYWGSTALTTTYESATQITARVPAADIVSAGNSIAITVQSPSPGGGTSNSFMFEVDSSKGLTTAPTFNVTSAIVSAGSPATYLITFPPSVESATVTCLNLPAKAACGYSAATNTLTITTSSITPKGTWQITVVFTETVAGAAESWIVLPILLLPILILRRTISLRGIWLATGVSLVLLAATAYTTGCGGGGSGSNSTLIPQIHQVVSSRTVSITIQ